VRGERDIQPDFAEFFFEAKGPVFRAILVSVGRVSLAEEAVAEAFSRAYERWPTLSQHPAPRAWVVRTALNCVRNERRKDRRLVGVATPEGSTTDDLPTDPDLVARVLRLPRRQREVVALRILLDLSTQQTSAALGIAAGTVTAHLHRALTRLEADMSHSIESEASG
jgi:RNA polymerase sigma-70 factor (ECF subfamily)